MARARRRMLTVASAVVTLTTFGSGVAVAAPSGSTAQPQIRFVAAASSVTVDSWEGEPVYLDLGTHVVAGANPLEVWVKRASYADPVVANQIVRSGGKQRSVPLPAGLVTDFTGFRNFQHVSIKDASGNTVVDRDETFCPNGYGSRTRPDAPDTSPYPRDCPWNPFTLGSVWGIQAGWSAPTASWFSEPVDLPEGNYTAVVSVNQPYRNLFGIPADQASATIGVTVRVMTFPDGGRALRAPDAAAAGPAATGALPQPAASRPSGAASVPRGPKPDLRSLPAWDIRADGDYLTFNATVWTAGTSPLVVDGFRRTGEDVMDAYQYFYDTKGNQVGYAPVGTMEWDARDGHEHWHFTDFAQYRLLDENKQVAVRSGKEAFCLANTDAVDYTLPNANWQPDGTDLHTACGGAGALSVREVLDIGSGDTYAQYLPGQSFDLTGLPNGTYYVEVSANPDHKLYETSTDNNVSLRKVILGGVPGTRTVEVPPHEGVSG
jgi:Lysyl oxidase